MTDHYLNQCRPDSLTHISSTRGRLVYESYCYLHVSHRFLHDRPTGTLKNLAQECRTYFCDLLAVPTMNHCQHGNDFLQKLRCWTLSDLESEWVISIKHLIYGLISVISVGRVSLQRKWNGPTHGGNGDILVHNIWGLYYMNIRDTTNIMNAWSF